MLYIYCSVYDYLGQFTVAEGSGRVGVGENGRGVSFFGGEKWSGHVWSILGGSFRRRRPFALSRNYEPSKL